MDEVIYAENPELDNVLEEITEKLQYSVDSGQEIENIQNILWPTLHNISNNYEIVYNPILMNISYPGYDIIVDDIIVRNMDIFYGIRNDNPFPIKISYSIGGQNLQMNYYEIDIEPDEISFILAGYPIILRSLQYHDIRYYVKIEHNFLNTQTIQLSIIGSLLHNRFHQYMTRNDSFKYVIFNNPEINNSMIKLNETEDNHIVGLLISGMFGISYKKFTDKYKNVVKSNVLCNSYAIEERPKTRYVLK